MKLILIPLLLVTSWALASCGGTPASSNPSTEVTVEAKEFQFTPSTVNLTAGQTVTIKLVNVGTAEHDFSILLPDGMSGVPDQHITAEAGGSARTTFTPSKPGDYQFFCSVPGHKDAGMAGTLHVKEP